MELTDNQKTMLNMRLKMHVDDFKHNHLVEAIYLTTYYLEENDYPIYSFNILINNNVSHSDSSINTMNDIYMSDYSIEELGGKLVAQYVPIVFLNKPESEWALSREFVNSITLYDKDGEIDEYKNRLIEAIQVGNMPQFNPRSFFNGFIDMSNIIKIDEIPEPQGIPR